MVYLFIYLVLVYMTVTGMKVDEPFEGMFRVMFPYDKVDMKLDTMMLIFSIALYMLMLSILVKCLDEQLSLNKYRVVSETNE